MTCRQSFNHRDSRDYKIPGTRNARLFFRSKELIWEDQCGRNLARILLTLFMMKNYLFPEMVYGVSLYSRCSSSLKDLILLSCEPATNENGSFIIKYDKITSFMSYQNFRMSFNLASSPAALLEENSAFAVTLAW